MTLILAKNFLGGIAALLASALFFTATLVA